MDFLRNHQALILGDKGQPNRCFRRVPAWPPGPNRGVPAIFSKLYPPGAKKISAKCSTAMVSWGTNCSSPRLLNITCGDLLPSPLPFSPTGRGKGEGDLWRYFLQRLGLSKRSGRKSQKELAEVIQRQTDETVQKLVFEIGRAHV